MGQIGEAPRFTAGIVRAGETRRGQARRLRYVLPRLRLHVSPMAERVYHAGPGRLAGSLSNGNNGFLLNAMPYCSKLLATAL